MSILGGSSSSVIYLIRGYDLTIPASELGRPHFIEPLPGAFSCHLLEISRRPESLQWPHLTPTTGASAAHRSPRSGGCCGPSRGPTVRSAGSSTATSTASSASRCWLPNRCAPGNSRPSPPGASGSGSGVLIPYPGREHRPGSSRLGRLLSPGRQDVLQRRDGTRPRARGRPRAGGGASG